MVKSHSYNNSLVCPPSSPLQVTLFLLVTQLRPQLWLPSELHTGDISLARSRSNICPWTFDWLLRYQVSQTSWLSDGTCQLCGNWPVFVVTMATSWQSVARLLRMQPWHSDLCVPCYHTHTQTHETHNQQHKYNSHN